MLISPKGEHCSVAVQLRFPCTNNVAEYEARFIGLQAALDFEIQDLEVNGTLSLSFRKLLMKGQLEVLK